VASAREQPIANAEAACLGFLGAWRLPYENKRKPLLVFLGCPWILSSKSSDINGLCGINGEGNFLDGLLARRPWELTVEAYGSARLIMAKVYASF
jgi:hypothetical protein